ncbi:WD40 repeat-like protein [Poronia punctata]|nr:WD40 repeat-like protein [Poronia punctata]
MAAHSAIDFIDLTADYNNNNNTDDDDAPAGALANGNTFLSPRKHLELRPPAKRQRTESPPRIGSVGVPGTPGTPLAAEYDVTEALGRCLEAQVFPHVERATSALPADVFDVDKIGAAVVRKIVDRGFEQHFREGGGRLSSTKELIIAASIHRLVTELVAGPDYRRATPTSPVHPGAPAIIQSIEEELHDGTTSEDEDEIIKYEDETESEQLLDYEEDFEDDLEEGFEEAPEELEEERRPIPEFDGLLYSQDIPEALSQRPSQGPSHAPSPQPGEFQSFPAREKRKRKKKKEKKSQQQVNPQQLRTTARTFQWKSGQSYNSAIATKSQPRHRPHFLSLPLPPYMLAAQREQVPLVSNALSISLPLGDDVPDVQALHVDFTFAEVHYLQRIARSIYGRPFVNGERSIPRDLRNVLKKVPEMRNKLVELHRTRYDGYDAPPSLLTRRSPDDVTNFLDDLYRKKLSEVPVAILIERNDPVAQSEASRASQVSSLLLSREIVGNKLGWARTYKNFKTAVKSYREDNLEPRIEWTNCAGDIMTVSWLSNNEFVCGTTTHSDSHNQQYNKPGNLLLGSTETNSLRAYPDHRVVRPRVSTGENASDSMVASQDPWLFTSVVSSDFDPSCGLAFTSSFDNTVKIWRPQGESMVALGTWQHGGHVNFVVTSKNGTGAVATAADVPAEAVRVYRLDRSNVSGSPYDSYSCTRVGDEDYIPSDKWAYYPAAIRWGLAPSVQHLLLIGYSPRSPTGRDDDIPEDKSNTGELCLWDTITKKPVKVNSAKTQNVFEVAWHPSHARFLAATSASHSLEKADQTSRTQIRIFELNNDTGQYTAMKTLECPAIDINELSMKPNCLNYAYVAASCTDGRVYVWDTAGSDLPICVLEHGEPVEELLGDREVEDVGVKFTAWATTADRLYTGSSDGVVKVWNIRHGRCVLVRDLIEVAAPITCGAFSPDFTKLVIGDGSGRVYLLTLEEDFEEEENMQDNNSSAFLKLETSRGQQLVRRPRPFLPHPELPPPVDQSEDKDRRSDEDESAARRYLETAQLLRHPDPTIGVVQGPSYYQTGLFRTEAHMDGNPNLPLLSPFAMKQQIAYHESHPQDQRLNTFPRQQQQQQQDIMQHDNQEQFSSGPSSREDDDDDGGGDGDDDECQFDHATWQELIQERAEITDRLIDFEYETSIYDSEEEEEEETGDMVRYGSESSVS